MTDLNSPTTDATVADMNGALAYWGPVCVRPAAGATQPVRLTLGERAALLRLRQTLHGRTWSGTNRLMSGLFAGAHQSL